MERIERGARRKSASDLFLSHSSKDQKAARKIAIDLTFCGVDAWLDEWEVEPGQSLTDVLADAMSKSKYIAILMTENYNTSIWTKTEYKQALSREQKEGRIVMLPLLLSGDTIPDFIQDKIYIDLRHDYFAGIARLTARIREVPQFRINQAIEEHQPNSISKVWDVLRFVGFEPYIVLEGSDFDEILRSGGRKIDEKRAVFYPDMLLDDPNVSDHIKSLVREMLA